MLEERLKARLFESAEVRAQLRAIKAAVESGALTAEEAVERLGTLLSRRAEITIPGTLIGGLFITFLGNGLTLLGLGAPFRYGLNGAFILLAMAIGALKRN